VEDADRCRINKHNQPGFYFYSFAGNQVMIPAIWRIKAGFKP